MALAVLLAIAAAGIGAGARQAVAMASDSHAATGMAHCADCTVMPAGGNDTGDGPACAKTCTVEPQALAPLDRPAARPAGPRFRRSRSTLCRSQDLRPDPHPPRPVFLT